ncbi:hypothetical protein [Amycolatopsis sp. NPDC021455]|uniref:hypothetical protein n=1 Tax=Amycolatopsis sp. NPDC021455 TaxID=3154901 RepID=UPI0033C55942
MTVVPAYERKPRSISFTDRALARYYRVAFAWPAVAGPAGVRLRLGDVVDALAVRAPLAAEVDHTLVQSLLGAPVVELRDPGVCWIFLTQPRIPLRPSTWDDLTRAGIEWSEPGTSLPLPALRGGGNGLRWRKCPVHGTKLPPWTAVVGAIRSAVSRSSACPLRKAAAT